MPESANAWRCLVCGYVHRGPEAPDACPICGAGAEDFEAYEEEAAQEQELSNARVWRCTVCNYEHEGDEPPDECPICGAAKDLFEAAADGDTEAASGALPASTIVVLGGGVAGVSAVEAICKRTAQADVTLISREDDLPYWRLNLSRFLAGEITADDLPIHPADWYAAKNVDLRLGTEAVELDPAAKQVRLRNGETLSYDKLVLTAGAHAFIPPIGGAKRDNVLALRTITDAREVLAKVASHSRAVVIGGGILGLEAAGALAKQGADVTLLEGFDYLMPRQLNAEAAKRMAAFVESIGVTLRANAMTKEILGDEAAAGVLLDDGTTIPADLVIIATGIRCNSYLARKAGLDVGKGVVVDDRLLTSDPDIYAAGDVAEHRGICYGLWNAAQYQGGIAGLNACGGDAEFGGIPRSNTLKVLGLDMFSIGDFNPSDGSYRVVAGDEDEKFYHFVFHDSRLVGAILLGDTSLSGAIKHAVEQGTDFSALLEDDPKVKQVADALK